MFSRNHCIGPADNKDRDRKWNCDHCQVDPHDYPTDATTPTSYRIHLGDGIEL